MRRTAIWLFGTFTERGLTLLETSWHDRSMLTPGIVELYTRPTEIHGWERALWEFTARNVELAGKLPNAAVQIIAQSGHLPHEETSAEFLLALRGFSAHLLPQ